LNAGLKGMVIGSRFRVQGSGFKVQGSKVTIDFLKKGN
jgi:hypothetical protein